MKAFEDWSYNQYRNKVMVTCDHCTDYIEGIEDGWRAALEWARVKVENYTPEDICYFIDEELGVEDESV